MTTMKMIGKALLMICCAPIVLIGMVFAIYGALVVGVVRLIRGKNKEDDVVLEQMTETSAQLVAEGSKMIHPASHATV
ncbi:MAG: hypothetical protein GX808_07545 [Syntrophomonadaceae bacterium]|nr:hypothetical protein [Syntrophomonadaceae bacterium]